MAEVPFSQHFLTALVKILPNETIFFGGSFWRDEQLHGVSDCDIYIVSHKALDTARVLRTRDQLKEWKQSVYQANDIEVSIHIMPEFLLRLGWFKLSGKVVVSQGRDDDLRQFISYSLGDTPTHLTAVKSCLCSLARAGIVHDGVALSRAALRVAQLIAHEEGRGQGHDLFSYQSVSLLVPLLQSITPEEEQVLSRLLMGRMQGVCPYDEHDWRIVTQIILDWMILYNPPHALHLRFLYGYTAWKKKRWRMMITNQNTAYLTAVTSALVWRMDKRVDNEGESQYYIKRCIEQCSLFEDIPDALTSDSAPLWCLGVLEKYRNIIFVI
ncbi:MAG: hypothetical protein A3H59_01015 [Candidatus Jacksonbacteria bacterium RIFCSPLOWO2_02_FULL_43_9]|nr:MAG: hypothetical protein UV70_C0001G0013 [Parcubacteria group bacterium GW2011_GWA2_43_13]OGY68982.1 MAG: hypothetical protein A3B94_02265 [Candidatus Jacksonbacteria bacterium RIFCSPHIGHO2_02_FULL_43_10]OGY70369.1 MAG: hypothetical protein A2986_00230 [Candidatus Jacksonbacteria bacterium RIFCSPLOWO2_01_FULL_44_13]OGY73802.1 MAG: hypothetical protein A3H59_01015 [Candidatus Jacksonbacteria bacterium RIFCSPLOWO2_02_FULL_43_9]HAZ16561.1 hypothetical protein [Candidatus Jacksonbacteria bacter